LTWTAGERIVSVDGTPTPTSMRLGTAVASLRPGERVSIGFSRQTGARSRLVLTVGQYPGTAA
jgi:S1-C subfamily serine protease